MLREELFCAREHGFALVMEQRRLRRLHACVRSIFEIRRNDLPTSRVDQR